eukprot:6856586-Alexandrium_andersonii.AAC.1
MQMRPIAAPGPSKGCSARARTRWPGSVVEQELPCTRIPHAYFGPNVGCWMFSFRFDVVLSCARGVHPIDTYSIAA